MAEPSVKGLSVVINGKRGEVDRKTYVFTEDMLPHLLQHVPELTLMQFATYVESTSRTPFMVKVEKNRFNGTSVRESIPDLLEYGMPITEAQDYEDSRD